MLSADNYIPLTVLSYSVVCWAPSEVRGWIHLLAFVSFFFFFPNTFFSFTISIPLQSWFGHYGACLLIHMDINYKIIHSMRIILSRYAIFSMLSLVFQKSFANVGNARILASQTLSLLVCQ